MTPAIDTYELSPVQAGMILHAVSDVNPAGLADIIKGLTWLEESIAPTHGAANREEIEL